MIHRRASNLRLSKAPVADAWSDLRNGKSNRSINWTFGKLELQRSLLLLRHGNKTRSLVLVFSSLALLVSLTCLMASWVDSWATSVSMSSLMVAPNALTSSPPLIPGRRVLPFNPNYRIPESHPQVGDRSDQYARLRQEVDRRLPFSPSRSLKALKEQLRHGQATNYSAMPMTTTMDQETYDIYNCPETPPLGYPFAWPLADLLSAWPPQDTSKAPERAVHQGLCVFQFPQDLAKALVYKQKEVPFVVQGDPHIARTVERWNQPGYLSRLLGSGKIKHRTEYSPNNHFLYRVPGSKQAADGTELKWLTYEDWLAHANVTDDLSDPNDEHWYFRLIGCGAGKLACDKQSSEYLFDELPFFQPTWQANNYSDDEVGLSTQLYMGDEGDQQRGIHCRFGMRGVIAENHYDTSRNAIVLLGGSRRYILAHPNQCPYMSLYEPSHPSARHSNFDWSSGDVSSFPDVFKDNAKGNEVVLQAGQAMYLPTFWFHYIVSLELNFQCNTRSGVSMEYAKGIEQCGV